MRWIFALAGGFVGFLSGGGQGLLVGLVLGLVVHEAIRRHLTAQAQDANRPLAPGPGRQAPVAGTPPSVDERLTRLEREMAALGADVRLLLRHVTRADGVVGLAAPESASTEAAAEAAATAEVLLARVATVEQRDVEMAPVPMAGALARAAAPAATGAAPLRAEASVTGTTTATTGLRDEPLAISPDADFAAFGAESTVPASLPGPATSATPHLPSSSPSTPLPATTAAGLPATPPDGTVEANVATTAPPAITATSPPTMATAVTPVRVNPTPGALPPHVLPPAPPSPPPPPAKSWQENLPPFVHRLLFGGNLIVKVGVLILFLGLAFLLRYAAANVVVPVELRYAGVALAGVALLVVGWRLRAKADAAGRSGYGLVLQGAGIGVLYLTTLSALKISALLPPELAFGFLFAVTVLSAVLAVAQNAPWLATIAAAEGFAAPVLVSTGSGNHIALFSYLAILDLGIVGIAWFRAWRPLNLIAATGTFALAGAWADKYYVDALYPSTQGFLLLFFVLFTAVSVLFARRALALGRPPTETDPIAARALEALAQVGRVDSTLVFGVPLASYGLQHLLVRDFAHGPALAAFGFAAFYLLLGGALLRAGTAEARRRYALLGETYVILAVIFGTLTIPLALEGAWTGATWAVEAAGMYWLGLRQQRAYARGFALLVLGAAAVRMASSLRLDLAAGTPLLDGSVFGLALLGVSAGVMVWLAQRLAAPAGWERAGRDGALVVAVASAATIPWLLLVPLWAAVATSALALACALADARRPLAMLAGLSAALHGVALVGFASTLHRRAGVAMLDAGWEGLVAALAIGGSLVATGALSLRAAQKAARTSAPDAALPSSAAGAVGLLSGLAVLAVSLLFVMPAGDAAAVWPWLGVAALWPGLRLGSGALVLGWLVLQGVAGIAFVLDGPPLWSPALTGLAFGTPLSLSLAAFVAGDRLHRAARTALPGSALGSAAPQWAVVLWALAWWSQVLLPEVWRALARNAPELLELRWPTVLAAWVLLTSVLVQMAARWRDWRALGQATWATVPGWCVAAVMGVGALGFAPHAHWGWAVWPAALLWNVLLLRQQPRWVGAAAAPSSAQSAASPAQSARAALHAVAPLHMLGFGLFLALAAREGQWLTAGWGDVGSAWPVLGAAAVPAAVLALMATALARRRWPLAAFPHAYLLSAAGPVALALLAWVWAVNTGPGTAAPLPYVPLLNPLEIGQLLVLFALLRWQRAWPADAAARLPATAVPAVAGLTLFALVTGAVLRTCHHWAGVPWEAAALWSSTLTQAALSVTWSATAVALMLVGNRRARRAVWAVGAVLLAVVVVKLFLVELADRGGLYRIVSFIVVGLLLLLVGYFAPVPPARAEVSGAGESDASGSAGGEGDGAPPEPREASA